jgi:hypothetical protein
LLLTFTEHDMRKLGLGLLCLAITSCITTHATLVDPTATRYPRVPPDSVRIFTDQSELDTLDFVRIAIIEASGSGEWTNQSEMLRPMRTQETRALRGPDQTYRGVGIFGACSRNPSSANRGY